MTKESLEMTTGYRNLTTICLASVFAFGLTACGGGSSTTAELPPPTPVQLSLSSVPDHGLTATSFTIAAGGSQVLGNVAFACGAGGDDCMIDVTMGADGTYMVTSTGGMASVMYSAAYTAGMNTDAVQAAHDALEAADEKVTMYTAANDSAQEALNTANSSVAAAVMALTALDSTATATEIAAANAAYQAAIAAQVSAMTASDAAMENLATATQDYRDAYAALAAVDPNSTALMEARAKIAMLEEAAEMAAEKAREDLAALQGQIDEANKTLAALQKQIDDAAKAIADAAAKAMAAGYSDALKRSAAHLEDTANTDGEVQRRSLRLESANGTTGGALLSVKRVDSVTMKAKDFMVQTEMPADVGTGWTGRTLVRDAKNIATSPETVPGTVTATVYSDIEVAKSRTLDSLDWTTTNFPAAFEGATASVPAVISGVTGQKRVTLDTGSQEWPGSATGSKIPTTLNATETITDSFTGTLHGISGTFRCGTGPCSIQKFDDDTYSVTGTITFDAASSAVVRIQDADYMTFGYWATEPDEGTGAAHHYSVGTFANAATAVNTTTAMTGTATYEGPAAGVYSEAAHSGKAARSGSFTAEASLSANFGNGTEIGHLSGMVSDFMSNGESLGDWEVTLGGGVKPAAAVAGTSTTGATVALDVVDGTAVTNSELTAGASGTVMALTADSAVVDGGSTTGKFDGLSGSGNWQAQFSGANAAANTTDGPNSVSGTFDVNAANVVRVSGAFGAAKE